MKRHILIAIFVPLVFSVCIGNNPGGENDAEETDRLVPSAHRLFGQVEGKVTTFLRSPAMITSFGLNYRHSIATHDEFGLYYGINYSMLTSVESINNAAGIDANNELAAEHVSAGIKIGYFKRFTGLKHPLYMSPDVIVGWANLIYTFTDGFENRQNYFQMEPGFNLAIGLKKSDLFQFGFGATYRIAAGVNEDNLKNLDVMGPSGAFFIRIGRFPY